MDIIGAQKRDPITAFQYLKEALNMEGEGLLIQVDTDKGQSF